MPEIHFICGFMGFGKTTLAKQLEKQLPAIRFTHDEFMKKMYGRNPDNFSEKYKIVDDLIWNETKKAIQTNKNVILDYGFWDKATRKSVMEKALKLVTSSNIYWHLLVCDLTVAKQRVMQRTEDNQDELFIDENCFDMLSKKWQPITDDENLNVIRHKS